MGIRAEFSSRMGFIIAAAGSTVGLGNIWGFPTQVASHGGAAFVLFYIILTFLLAYPVLMAELVVGRYAKANVVTAMEKMTAGHRLLPIGRGIGFVEVAVASLILSFYAIVAGWVIAFCVQAFFSVLGWDGLSHWLTTFGLTRNLLFCALFYLLTIKIVRAGINNGIERWSARLMPVLLLMIVALIIYVATLDGAATGWKIYWVPDFSQVLKANLFLSAMGQAFFSLSLGVGSMLVYGSYISHKENLPSLGLSVTLMDISIAILAGLLIIPAMYVAQHNGIQIYTASGQLIAGDALIFTVLPALFNTMGVVGNIVAFLFFILLTIAALTSSISMLEVPVSYIIENHDYNRAKAAWLTGGLIFLLSMITIFNFESLFSLIITVSTRYSQPCIGFLLCLFVGWVWQRNQLLTELKQGYSDVAQSFFWKIWPSYVRFICPVIMIAVFYKSLIAD